ncbi:unnamed protein product [Cyclocybe aegerita]|uniref:F-box domain-containing protein n=1 Tax=Cyclocybe aegerita TaxID=1973307 RepID=A0A8S0WN15_CYCAE|nr:unnamed protein product [Cyclocybe aegerita]
MAKAAFEEAQSKLWNLKKKLQETQDTRKPFLKKIAACDVALSPMRRVPVDILREIFPYTLKKPPTAHRKRAPLSLSHVSSNWRRTIHSIPLMWSHLKIPLKGVFDRYYQKDMFVRYQSQVAGFLNNSGDLPATLQLILTSTAITGDPDDLACDEKATMDMFDDLLAFVLASPKVTNMGQLEVQSPFLQRTIIALSNVQRQLPQLKSFKLKGSLFRDYWPRELGPPLHDSDGDSYLARFLTHAPNLRDLYFVRDVPIRVFFNHP